MKHIKKLLKNEPDTLKDYRKTTPNASFKGFGDPDQKLKKALLLEQGEVCAYCMQRISLDLNQNYKPKIEVEHILPQKGPHKNIKKALDYSNMVGVCNGNSVGQKHCDKSKEDELLKRLSPLKENCETLITYSTSGLIISISNNDDVEYDINDILNLNNQNLVDMRRNAIDLALEKLITDYPVKDWTHRLFEKEIELYKNKNRKGQYKQFSNYVIWYLEKLKKSPRYQ